MTPESFIAKLEKDFNDEREFIFLRMNLPAPTANNSDTSMDQMAHDLYSAVSRFTDESAPMFVQVCADGRSANLEVGILRDCSVDEISHLLGQALGASA